MQTPGDTRFRRTEILVIGAGISGLMAARDLTDAGAQVLIVDKGRGVGGRMATRRLGAAHLDHGAQFLTAHTQRFRDALLAWEKAGVLGKWFVDRTEPNRDRVRWSGCPSMTAIPKHLARGLELILGHPVVALERHSSSWSAHLLDGSIIEAEAVLLTAPVPQSLALLSQGGFALQKGHARLLGGIRYEPCIALLAELEGPSGIPAPGWIEPETGPIASLADNQQKGISNRPAVTIHAGAQFSQEHLEAEDAVIASKLLFAGEPWLKGGVHQYQVHRWRYSKPIVRQEVACLQVCGSPPLVLAGDGFGGPRVEGAALSGWAAAELLRAAIRAS